MPRITFIRLLALLAFFVGTVSAEEMTFDILYMNHTNVVVADGEITQDTPDNFRRFLASDPFDGYIYVVALNSPGGNLYAGLELGRLIREAGLNTSVEKYPFDPEIGQLSHIDQSGHCYSACALAFLGGRTRTLNTPSKLGFHQFSRASNSYLLGIDEVWDTQKSSQAASADILEFLVEMRINPELFSKLSKTLPNDMFIPTADESSDLKITTPSAFQDFGFEPYKKGVVAYSVFPENAIGRNLVGQVTTYCKRGEPYLLLSLPPGSQALDSVFIDNLENHQNGYTLYSDVNSIYYDPDALSFYKGGLPIVEIKLDTDGIELIKSGVSGHMEAGMIMGGYFFSIEPSLVVTIP